MARPLRVEYAGALYHITSRGNARQDIYDTDGDRQQFLQLLGHVCERFDWLCHAYCLMSNHYHLHLYHIIKRDIPNEKPWRGPT